MTSSWPKTVPVEPLKYPGVLKNCGFGGPTPRRSPYCFMWSGKVSESRMTGGSSAAAHSTSAIASEASSPPASASACCAASRKAGPAAIAADMLDGNSADATRRAAAGVAPARRSRACSAVARSTTRPSSGCAATSRSTLPSGLSRRMRPSFMRLASPCRRVVSYRIESRRVRRSVSYRYQPMASRSEESRSAILQATVELLEDTTVQKLSIEAIAKRAGVGKTTIYRWWPSKAAVVIDAFMEHHLVKTPIPDDASVRDALRTHLRSLIRQYRGPSGRLVAQIIAESQYDPSTLADFRGRFWDGRRDAVHELLERGVKSGEIRGDVDVDLVVEMLYSPIYLRLLFGYRPLNERYADSALELAFDGVGD